MGSEKTHSNPPPSRGSVERRVPQPKSKNFKVRKCGCMSACVRVCVCVYVCECVHVYVCLSVYVCMYMCVCLHECAHASFVCFEG